jgi:hypothetical protein
VKCYAAAELIPEVVDEESIGAHKVQVVATLDGTMVYVDVSFVGWLDGRFNLEEMYYHWDFARGVAGARNARLAKALDELVRDAAVECGMHREWRQGKWQAAVHP